MNVVNACSLVRSNVSVYEILKSSDCKLTARSACDKRTYSVCAKIINALRGRVARKRRKIFLKLTDKIVGIDSEYYAVYRLEFHSFIVNIYYLDKSIASGMIQSLVSKLGFQSLVNGFCCGKRVISVTYCKKQRRERCVSVTLFHCGRRNKRVKRIRDSELCILT